MDGEIIHTTDILGERVTSSYAEIYFYDKHCNYVEHETFSEEVENIPKDGIKNENDENLEWESPSDALIGIIELIPPFTSKIHRGKTHEGIIEISNKIFEEERQKFLDALQILIQENNDAWRYVRDYEKDKIVEKVKQLYKEIFTKKSTIMAKEMTTFYEKNLIELENNLKEELPGVLMSVHSNIVSDLNFEIRQKLLCEKKKLEKILWDRYFSEIKKINLYYKLLLENEYHLHNKRIKSLIIDRNDALTAFYKYFETETTTSTMYILSSQRQKCRIKKFQLTNYQSSETKEILQKIKDQSDILSRLKKYDVPICEINRQWEEKIEKIMQIFLKFMSFSLKLLPEQSDFLLDLKNMVLLQLHELQKTPKQKSSILLDDQGFNNCFSFHEPKVEEPVCVSSPFKIEGDLTKKSDDDMIKYGSRETLPSDVELPYFRFKRKFIYAECHKLNEIQDLLEQQRCKCKECKPEEKIMEEVTEEQEIPKIVPECEPIIQPIIVNDFKRQVECPARKCQDWSKGYSFPKIDDYVDFTEEKFEVVKAIFNKPHPKIDMPKFIEAIDIANKKMQFEQTKEIQHDVATQYSDQDLPQSDQIFCSCCKEELPKVTSSDQDSLTCNVEEAIKKRQHSLFMLINEHPKVLKLFDDGAEDFNI